MCVLSVLGGKKIFKWKRERERGIKEGGKIIRWNIQIPHGKGKKTRSSTSRFYISREKINLMESRY